MNDVGQVVEHAQTADGKTHAFLWQRGRMIDLGTLPGGSFSNAVDINTSGLVAGNPSDGAGTSHAVVWINGRILDLGSLGGDGGSVAMAYGFAADDELTDINERGLIAGTRAGRATLFRWGVS